MFSGLSLTAAAAIPYIAIGALTVGCATGGYVAWNWQSGRVVTAQSERDRLSEAVAARDNTIAEMQRAGRDLTASAKLCSASVAVLAEQGARTEQEAARALQAARQGQDATRAAIGALAGRIQAGGVSCEAAAAEVRGLLR